MHALPAGAFNDEVDNTLAQRQFVHPLSSATSLGMSVLRSGPTRILGEYDATSKFALPNLLAVPASCSDGFRLSAAPAPPCRECERASYGDVRGSVIQNGCSLDEGTQHVDDPIACSAGTIKQTLSVAISVDHHFESAWWAASFALLRTHEQGRRKYLIGRRMPELDRCRQGVGRRRRSCAPSKR